MIGTTKCLHHTTGLRPPLHYHYSHHHHSHLPSPPHHNKNSNKDEDDDDKEAEEKEVLVKSQANERTKRNKPTNYDCVGFSKPVQSGRSTIITQNTEHQHHNDNANFSLELQTALHTRKDISIHSRNLTHARIKARGERGGHPTLGGIDDDDDDDIDDDKNCSGLASEMSG